MKAGKNITSRQELLLKVSTERRFMELMKAKRIKLK